MKAPNKQSNLKNGKHGGLLPGSSTGSNPG